MRCGFPEEVFVQRAQNFVPLPYAVWQQEDTRFCVPTVIIAMMGAQNFVPLRLFVLPLRLLVW
jgi:hypothetical protein